MIEIIEQVKKVRRHKGYSQEVMAHELNISQAAYAKLEKNTTRLTVKRLFKIAEILETDVSELLNIEEQNLQPRLDVLIDKLEALINGTKDNLRGGGVNKWLDFNPFIYFAKYSNFLKFSMGCF